MKKRLFCLLLIASLVLAMLPTAVWAAEQTPTAGVCGDKASWSLDTKTGALSITGTGAMYDYDYSDTAPWHARCSEIRTVTVASGITSVGSYAFYTCTAMTEITLPDSITAIGDGAFYDCTALRQVSVPIAVTRVGENAFQNCVGLTAVKLPSALRELCASAFSGCTGLTEFEIPAGVTAVGDYAFSGCTALKELTLLEGLQTVGTSAFAGCTSLKEVSFPSTFKSLGRSAFAGCTALTSATFLCDAPKMAAAGDSAASLPAGTKIAFLFSRKNWDTPTHKGYAAEEYHPDISEIFDDVTTKDWYSEYVEYVYFYGLMNGTATGTFSPNAAMTRAMLVTVLYRFGGSPQVTVTDQFRDVPASAYYAAAVSWAAGNKLVNGTTSNTFSPDSNISRQDVATMLYRYATALRLDMSVTGSYEKFPDAGQVADYAKQAMSWALGAEILNGSTDGKLHPTGNATRAEVSKMLAQFAKYRDEHKPSQDPDDPDDPKEAQQLQMAESVFRAINAERVKNGKAALTWSPRLYTAARQRAGEITDNACFSGHKRPNGSAWYTILGELSIPYVDAQEILAKNYDQAAPLVSAWMGSESHKAVILSDRYKESAVGAYQDENGKYFFVQIFIE